MEYVPLGSLSSVLQDNSFSSYMRCRFMLDVAYGMQYLHGQGIIHRDLKPGNVLVASLDPNADILCKISDFGESRKGLEQTRTMTMTRGVGSPFYMAPEMIEGNTKYTRAVDVYSFSIMCVELWNESLPYSELQFDTPFAFAMYVMDGYRPQIREDCPPDLAELIFECWDQERTKRPPFDNVAKELRSVVGNIHQTMPKDVEHVKSKHGKTNGMEANETKSAVATKKKTKKKTAGHDTFSSTGIPMDEMA